MKLRERDFKTAKLSVHKNIEIEIFKSISFLENNFNLSLGRNASLVAASACPGRFCRGGTSQRKTSAAPTRKGVRFFIHTRFDYSFWLGGVGGELDFPLLLSAPDARYREVSLTQGCSGCEPPVFVFFFRGHCKNVSKITKIMINFKNLSRKYGNV